MTSLATMRFTRKPNILLTLFSAMRGRSKRINLQDSIPRISASWKGATVDESQLRNFNRLCEIDSDSVSGIFPFSFVYPIVQRILASREAPLSMFRVLNSRIQMIQHQLIETDKELDIFSKIKNDRIRPKGLELDIASVIKSGGTICWETTHTFYYRGKFGTPDESYVPPRFSPLSDGDTVDEWVLPEGVGLRFARILGDWNGLHYSKKYARMQGFERDFAQPLLVLAKVVDHFLGPYPTKRFELDVLFKGPLYYNSKVAIKSASFANGTRFDVYSTDNNRPSMSGEIHCN